MASTAKRPASRSKRKSRPLAFPVEFRLRIVKLYLEEGYSRKLLVEQFGISTHSIQCWMKAFRLHGAPGLEPNQSCHDQPCCAFSAPCESPHPRDHRIDCEHDQ